MSLGITAQGENLVFLLSLPRSGSTLLSLILGNHPRVLCPPEPWLLLKLLSLRERGDIDSRYDDELATIAIREFLSESSFVEAARAFAVSAYSSRLEAAGRSVFIDKTPRYYHVLPWLDRFFPKSRKIWLRRNPLDIAASQKAKWGVKVRMLTGEEFGPQSFDLPIGLFALDEYFEHPSPSRMALSYESLVKDPRGVAAELCAFLRLDFDPSLLEYAASTTLQGMHRSASMGDKQCLAQSEIGTDSVGRWKRDLSLRDTRALVELLGLEVFARNGYSDTAREVRALGLRTVSEADAAAKRADLKSRDVDRLPPRLAGSALFRAVKAARRRILSFLRRGRASPKAIP